ncbi:high mobility group box domain-containing protein [Radiomyces spectabilis]|uniref:high mobility group box domain-containing protein n=1 Tax=Radiomyces spectabilis TaxID=64574 RepID=UPI00221F7F29|nr:high mobility group box domain-containing protein [Radiomyces spectabilis]KAI8371415.1 high mobility group box domain-containing protein [Radiomyces spectabilis]
MLSTSANPTATTSSPSHSPDINTKYRELKRRIRDIEGENDALHVRIHKAQKNIKLLKLERSLLLDRLETMHVSPASLHDNMMHDDTMDLHLKSSAGTKLPKKKKDPNAPKGPGNVFFLFCRLERDKIKDENPQENLGEVTKILGQKWKAMTKEEKQKYYDMYKKEMDEYEEAMKKYNDQSAPSTTEKPATESFVAEHDAIIDDDPLEYSQASTPQHTDDHDTL